jgi:hypothetical protein
MGAMTGFAAAPYSKTFAVFVHSVVSSSSEAGVFAAPRASDRVTSTVVDASATIVDGSFGRDRYRFGSIAPRGDSVRFGSVRSRDARRGARVLGVNRGRRVSTSTTT